MLEHLDLDGVVRLGHADQRREVADALGGEAAPAQADIVGMRGSSQPRTCPSLTSRSSLRLDMTVYVRLRRANSYWCGADGTGRFSMSQS